MNLFFITSEFENHKNTECPTCGKCDGFVGEIITQNFIDKAVHIYRCDNSPRKSLLNLPRNIVNITTGYSYPVEIKWN